ncbi:extracellular solute-binding protein [Atopococcus tabaci]|uniref:extracellular solute-binding protein n=1 Tax=Atopococcus tabaci TaxID=269774 RepID=UPI00040A9F02|nr:extracellular solute-binding protein [Atopococcus tabaci]
MLKKKYLTAALFSALILSACGGGEAESNQEAGSSEGKTPIEITWRGTGEEDAVLKYLENFEKDFESENSDIDLVLTPIPGGEGDYNTRLALSMQSANTAPDVISEDTFILHSDAAANYLTNLDDYVGEWEEWDQFFENVKEGVTAADGSVYGIPTVTDTRGIWYNIEVFEEAGLPADWQPQSWDEILETAQIIKDSQPDVIPFSMNVAAVNGEATSMQGFQMLFYGTGDTLYDEEQQKWNVNSQGFVDALTFIDEFMNQRELGPSLSIALNNNYTPTVIQDMLPNNQVAMVLDGNWQVRNFLEGGVAEMENVEERIGFAPMPTQNGEEPGYVTMAGGWAWSIPENSQNKEEAWRVIQAMSDYESQLQRVNSEGSLTVRKDVAEDSSYLERPLIETPTKILENAHFRPKSDLYPNVSIEIQRAVEAVSSGSMTPEEAAEQYRQGVIDIVGEENTY